jgi:hypothetical protein
VRLEETPDRLFTSNPDIIRATPNNRWCVDDIEIGIEPEVPTTDPLTRVVKAEPENSE